MVDCDTHEAPVLPPERQTSLNYTRRLLDGTGAECRQEFTSLRGLLAHQRERKDGMHQSVPKKSDILSECVNNQCPNCGTVLSSIDATGQHLQHAYRKGCTLDAGYMEYDVVPPASNQCPSCMYEAQDTADLLLHVKTHLREPHPLVPDRDGGLGSRRTFSQEEERGRTWRRGDRGSRGRIRRERDGAADGQVGRLWQERRRQRRFGSSQRRLGGYPPPSLMEHKLSAAGPF